MADSDSGGEGAGVDAGRGFLMASSWSDDVHGRTLKRIAYLTALGVPKCDAAQFGLLDIVLAHIERDAEKGITHRLLRRGTRQ